MTYAHRARASATKWKLDSPSIPDEAHRPAGYRGRGSYPFCLPLEFADHNLLPHLRTRAIALFAELQIPWHGGVGGGPTNHLLSSQVQCANALTPMVDDPALILAAFGAVLPIVEVLPVEPGRWLTFEFIGEVDHFNEASRTGRRVRGANCTSFDAAFRYRTPAGDIELALVEWKYVETYLGHELSADRRGVREPRYSTAWTHTAVPIRTDLLPYADIFVEPFYQLVRQQLLAAELERRHELDAEVVRVVHVTPAGNQEYQASLNRDSHRALGSTVYNAWRRVLRQPDRWLALDSRVFCDPSITSPEYVARYDHD
jgi:hypothetical protein